MKIHFSNKVKAEIVILIIGLVIIAFFIVIASEKQYNPISISSISPPSSTTTILSSNSSSITTTSTATPPPVVTQHPTTTQNVPPPITPPVSIGHATGVAVGDELAGLNASDLNTRLNAIVALGVTWIRIDIEWGNVQYATSTSYDWSVYNPVVNAIIAHHLNVLGIIAYTPTWARVPGCTGGADCPPENPAQFATFAAEVANHYKNDGLHYWEIWNEPNDFDFWATKADCNAYTALLKAAYPAIKKADPDSVVITGGLSPQSTDGVNISETDFLQCIYTDGGKNYFDAVGDHPYTFPQFPSDQSNNAWSTMSNTSPSLRSIMIANGDANKKIWITEFGAPTSGPDPNWYVSEAQQAQMMTTALQLFKTYNWVGPLFWYTFKDGGTSTSTNENFFGLTRPDGSLKPAYTTLQNFISLGL